MRYYYLQHIEGYQRVKAEGKVAWGEIYREEGFENFAARDFLAAVLPTLRFDTPEPTAFNYGCCGRSIGASCPSSRSTTSTPGRFLSAIGLNRSSASGHQGAPSGDFSGSLPAGQVDQRRPAGNANRHLVLTHPEWRFSAPSALPAGTAQTSPSAPPARASSALLPPARALPNTAGSS